MNRDSFFRIMQCCIFSFEQMPEIKLNCLYNFKEMQTAKKVLGVLEND